MLSDLPHLVAKECLFFQAAAAEALRPEGLIVCSVLVSSSPVSSILAEL